MTERGSGLAPHECCAGVFGRHSMLTFCITDSMALPEMLSMDPRPNPLPLQILPTCIHGHSDD